MASHQFPMTMEKLPHEVLSDIFIRLLAKQLAQMRCVCKSWNALLSELCFVKLHLNRSMHNNDEILLFWREGFSFDGSAFTELPSNSPDLELINFIKLQPNPLSKKRSYYGSLIGSVNGLVCFSYGQCRDRLIYIWNPSLSSVLTLPPCSFPCQSSIIIHLWFGFDPRTDDYKVVKLTTLSRPHRIIPQCEVYSMRKGSWELISQRFPSHITWIDGKDVVCVDGHDGNLHWLGYTDLEGRPPMIVAFNLGAETFREIPLPHSIIHHHGYRSNVLGVSVGKLCVMSTVEDGGCEVWVMDEYGVPGSWVKHHAFSQFSCDTRPYGFTSCNEFLFQAGGLFGLYDPVAAKTKTLKTMYRNYKIGVTKIVEYVDSLVWVVPTKREMNCCSISRLQF